MLTPFIGAAVVGSGAASPEQTAVITALSMLAGGGIASALGQDPLAAATTAQNETLNNCSMHECWNGVKDKLTSFGSAFLNWMASPEGQLTTTMMAIQGDMGGGLGGTGGAVRNAAADAIESGVARAATRGSGLTVGEQIDILRSAATGKGNFALGEATAAESNALGQDWVGSGYRVSQTDGTTLISADGLRQYRPPASKSSSYATTGVQANFQSRSVPSGAWQDNGHLNITGQ